MPPIYPYIPNLSVTAVTAAKAQHPGMKKGAPAPGATQKK